MIWSHFFVAKTICAHFFVAKMIYAFFCRENDLRTSSGKFFRVESCHPESSDFLGLCMVVEVFLVLDDTKMEDTSKVVDISSLQQ